MYTYITRGLILVVAFSQIVPLVGVLGVDHLAGLYGLELENPNLEVLMRHRAVLFGILGFTIGYAAFDARYQPLAFAVSMLMLGSFLLLAASAAPLNESLRRLALLDSGVLVCWAFAVGSYVLDRRRQARSEDPVAQVQ